MEINKTTIAELLISASSGVSGPNVSNQMDRALMLTILDNQALILAALQNKSVQAIRERNLISFESHLEILETNFKTHTLK